MTDSTARSALAAVSDLIFATKIRGTAQALGVKIDFAKSADELKSTLRENQPALLIIDLNTADALSLHCVRELCEAEPRPFVVAYVSHVDEQLAAQAREAGADEVMPRSRFNHVLPALLAQHCLPRAD